MPKEIPSGSNGSITIFRNIPGTNFVVFFEPPLKEDELRSIERLQYPIVDLLKEEKGEVQAVAYNCVDFGDSNMAQGAGVLDFFRNQEPSLRRSIRTDAILNLGATSLADWER